MKIETQELGEELFDLLSREYVDWESDGLHARVEEEHADSYTYNGIIKISNGQRFLVTVVEIPV